jgi:hypothetical protein
MGRGGRVRVVVVGQGIFVPLCFSQDQVFKGKGTFSQIFVTPTCAMLPAYAKQIWEMYMGEAVNKGVPEALRACYVNDRIHFRMLFLMNVDKYDEHVLRTLFPITSKDCIAKHKLKAKACLLAMEEDETWTSIRMRASDVENLYVSRLAKQLYDQHTLSLYEKEPVRDVSTMLFVHLTSFSVEGDCSEESEDEC